MYNFNKNKKFYLISSFYFAFILAIYPLTQLFGIVKIVFYPLVLVHLLIFSGIIINIFNFNIPYFKVGLPIYLYYISLCLSFAWSVFPIQTIKRLLSLIIMIYIVYFSTILFSYGIRKWFFYLVRMLVFSISICWIYLYKNYGWIKIGQMDEKGTFFSQLGIAILIAVLPYLVINLFMKNKFIIKVFDFIIICIYIVLILVSSSRGAFLLSIAGIIMTIGISSDNLKKNFIIALTVSGISFFVIYYGYQNSIFVHKSIDNIIRRIISSTLLNSYLPNGSDYLRMLMFDIFIKIITSNPFFGIGYQAFKPYMEKIYGIGIMSHNFVVTAWGEGSLISLLLIIVLLYIGLKRLIKSIKFTSNSNDVLFLKGTLISYSMVWIHYLFQPQEYNIMFFLNIAIALSSYFYTRNVYKAK